MNSLRSLFAKFGIGTPSEPHDPLYIFLLDDDSRRHEWFKRRFADDYIDIAETVHDAIEMLKNNVYDALFLDHDLLPEHYHSEETDDERTGYAVALWLTANPKSQAASNITVHTRNADGAMRMVDVLRRAGRHAEYIPFPLLTQKSKTQLVR